MFYFLCRNSEQTTFVDMEIDQSDADIPDGQADEDFKFALEVNDREVACRLQVTESTAFMQG